MTKIQYLGADLAPLLSRIPAPTEVGDDPDILVLGDEKDAGRLGQLRYRRQRPTPVAVVHVDCQRHLKGLTVPYITFGLGRGHIQMRKLFGRRYQVTTPVGECAVTVPPGCRPLDLLAAIGVGLAMRIPLEQLTGQNRAVAA